MRQHYSWTCCMFRGSWQETDCILGSSSRRELNREDRVKATLEILVVKHPGQVTWSSCPSTTPSPSGAEEGTGMRAQWHHSLEELGPPMWAGREKTSNFWPCFSLLSDLQVPPIGQNQQWDREWRNLGDAVWNAWIPSFLFTFPLHAVHCQVFICSPEFLEFQFNELNFNFLLGIAWLPDLPPNYFLPTIFPISVVTHLLPVAVQKSWRHP